MTDNLEIVKENKPPKKSLFQQQPVFLKFLIISILLFVMFIPIGLVEGVIKSREQYKMIATSEITRDWGSSQKILGPILTVPVTIAIKSKEMEKVHTEYINVMPKSLKLLGTLDPEIRYKGIFKQPVYSANLQMTGDFPVLENIIHSLDMSEIRSQYSPDATIEMDWKNAFLNLSVISSKGISGVPNLTVNGQQKEFKPGNYRLNLLEKGIHSFIDLTTLKNKPINYAIDLKLHGSNSLEVIPLAKDNTVALQSTWKDPSFIGNYLPKEKDISQDGFKANWDLSYLATNLKQTWVGQSYSTDNNSLGVSLLVLVDSYRNAVRAVKYAVLFIALTFLTCFIFEITSKLRIHPFQYILLGLAMSIFYLLLVSISELASFGLAYLVSSAATILLISLYTYFVLARTLRKGFTIAMTVVLAFLYAYLYVLLQLEDLSLMLGSIGLFIALAAVMYATKDINWYNNTEKID